MIRIKNIGAKYISGKWSTALVFSALLMASIPLRLTANSFQNGLNPNSKLIKQTNNRASQPLPLSQALDLLGKTHNIDFTYRIDLLNNITVNYNPDPNSNPLNTLENLLQGTGLKYKQFTSGRIVVYKEKNRALQNEIKDKELNTPPLNTQPKKEENNQDLSPKNNKNAILITGTVKDSDGNPLIGASIVLKSNPSIGTIVDVEGNFTLDLPEATKGILIFSYIGYLNKEVTIEGSKAMNIILESNNTALDEVIVVGYGSQRRADVIGAVSSVKGENLNTKNVSNFDAALQGMAAGVSVLSQSGKPGAPSSIKIRGANSIQSSTEPLWVIDGMPVFSSPTGLGSSNQNPMSLINPNDIENIQILKDAAATSIYGSRGSNGVIIVTTKSGKNNKGTTNVNISSGVSDLTRTPYDVGYVNTQEWFQVMDAAYQNTFGRNFKIQDYYQFAPLAFDEIDRAQIESLNINTDWYNEVFRMGSFTDINVSSSKGTEKGSYYLSGNYRSEKGVLNYNQLDRLSLRSNLNFEPFNNLNFETKLSFSYTNNERREDDMTTLIKFALPWMPVYNPENPNVYFNPYVSGNIAAKNDAKNALNNVKQYRALGNVALQYNFPFVKGLFLRTELSADIIQSNLVDWRSRNIRLDGGKNPSAYAREEAVTYQSINYNVYSNYNTTFGKHSINAVLGVEAQRISQYERILAGEGLVGNYQELGNPKVPLNIDARKNNERYLLGYFGRVNYKYNDKYLFGVSARRDGSSVFSSGNRWGTFVAVSGGWILSEENFMQFLNKDIYLKLRGSYGETGNQSIPNNLQTINYFDRVVYGNRQDGGNGTLPSNLPVSDLTWETTRSTDIGLDFGVFKNRINGTIAYYHRFVDGMLLEAQLPTSAGVSPSREDADFGFLNTVEGEATNKIWSNIGSMVNSGFEFELYTVNFDRNNFKWTTSFNIAFNNNIIKGLTPDLDQSGSGITSSYSISRTGNRRNVWFVADYAGINPDNGVPYIYVLDKTRFKERGETKRLQTSSGQDSLILATRANIRENRFLQGNKSSDPVFYGGLNNRFEYKGFDLSVFLAFSGGNYLLDYDRQVGVYPNETRLILKEVLTNSWSKPGDQAKYPNLVARQTHEVSEGQFASDFGDENVFHNRELYKADFLRLRNISFGYNLPANLLNKMHLQGARFYISGNNLWTKTSYPGFDPEGIPNQAGGVHVLYNNTPIPQLKSFIIGLDIKI